MAQTSIHIEAVKTSSEVHNKRLKALDYVRAELTKNNSYWESDTQKNRLADIKARYKAATGQQLQKKATPIREGVVVIKDSTTMKDMQKLAQVLEDRFGIRCFQIAIHKDEGHVHAKEWTPNLHAHMVFDFTDQNGKSLKLRRNDMIEMQTLVAETLGMDRGVASDRKHLNALQYKIQKRIEQLDKLEHDTGLGAKFLAFFGVGELAAIRSELKDAYTAIEDLRKDKQKITKDAKAKVAEAEKKVDAAITAGKLLAYDEVYAVGKWDAKESTKDAHTLQNITWRIQEEQKALDEEKATSTKWYNAWNAQRKANQSQDREQSRGFHR